MAGMLRKLVLCVVVMVGGVQVMGDENFARESDGAEINAFMKGGRNVYVVGGYIDERWGDKSESAYTGTVGLGYFLWDDVSVNVEVVGYGWDQENEDVIAGGVNLLGRWHFIKVDDWTIYGDLGGGMLIGDDRIGGRLGTEFNFDFQVGFGATYAMRNDVYLMGGCRWFHLSNGDIKGVERNPSIDGYHAYVGLMFTY